MFPPNPQRAVLGVLLVLLATIAAVSERAWADTTLDMADGPARTLYQQWLNASRMPTAHMTVPVILQDCDRDALTCMTWRRGGVTVYFPDLAYLADPGYDGSDLADMHALFLHEFGHVLDWANRNGPHRSKFMRLLQLKGSWWSFRIYRVSPGEQFADAYAYCALGQMWRTSAYQGYRAYRPSVSVHRKVCRLIRRVGTTPTAPVPKWMAWVPQRPLGAPVM